MGINKPGEVEETPRTGVKDSGHSELPKDFADFQRDADNTAKAFTK